MLAPTYWGPLFAAGGALDASRYYVIVPDGIGAGKSSKPSDGLRAKFPKYNYDDMVRAQYLLVTEHLGVKKLRLVTGNSMGGMHTWMWGTMYPDAMSGLVPLASLPTEVAGRNWLTRRMLIDLIRNDPGYNGGNYTQQPANLALAQVYFAFATSGGNQGLHKLAPTNAKADEVMNQRIAQPTRADANDLVYQFEASKGYNPSLQLERIQAPLLVINSADDERNPPELGIMEREMKRVKGARVVLIPAQRGHARPRHHGDGEALAAPPRRIPRRQVSMSADAVSLTKSLLRVRDRDAGHERDCARMAGAMLQEWGYKVEYFEYAEGRTSVIARAGGIGREGAALPDRPPRRRAARRARSGRKDPFARRDRRRQALRPRRLRHEGRAWRRSCSRRARSRKSCPARRAS